MDQSKRVNKFQQKNKKKIHKKICKMKDQRTKTMNNKNKEFKRNKFKYKMMNNLLNNNKSLKNKRRMQKIKNSIIQLMEDKTTNLHPTTTSKMIQMRKTIKLVMANMTNKETKMKGKRVQVNLFILLHHSFCRKS
jgi:predicted polyphosphate/ATP-dependent NAD kinase